MPTIAPIVTKSVYTRNFQINTEIIKGPTDFKITKVEDIKVLNTHQDYLKHLSLQDPKFP